MTTMTVPARETRPVALRETWIPEVDDADLPVAPAPRTGEIIRHQPQHLVDRSLPMQPLADLNELEHRERTETVRSRAAMSREAVDWLRGQAIRHREALATFMAHDEALAAALARHAVEDEAWDEVMTEAYATRQPAAERSHLELPGWRDAELREIRDRRTEAATALLTIVAEIAQGVAPRQNALGEVAAPVRGRPFTERHGALSAFTEGCRDPRSLLGSAGAWIEGRA